MPLDCVTGPSAPAAGDCACFDVDGDGDADFADCALLQLTFTA